MEIYYLRVLEAVKSTIKAPADSMSGEGSFPSLQMAVFSPMPSNGRDQNGLGGAEGRAQEEGGGREHCLHDAAEGRPHLMTLFHLHYLLKALLQIQSRGLSVSM